MYDIFKIIKRYITKYISQNKIKKQKHIFQEEYYILLNKLNSSRTLSDLFNAKREIEQFQKSIKAIDNPTWATNYIKFLNARWKLRYRLWKLRG